MIAQAASPLLPQPPNAEAMPFHPRVYLQGKQSESGYHPGLPGFRHPVHGLGTWPSQTGPTFPGVDSGK